MTSLRRSAYLVVCSYLALALAPRAASAQQTAECAAAYEKAQRLRREGALRSALEQAVACAKVECPTQLRKECTEWIDPLRQSIPSISVRVVGKDGCDTLDASITVDGRSVALDGRSIDVDPGVHVLRVAATDAAPIERQLVVAQGEKDRPITVRLAADGVACGAPLAAAPPLRELSPPSRPTPVLVYVLGGASVVAFGLATGFAISAFDRKSELDACRPRCGHDEADTMRAHFLVADLAGAAGLLSLAAAAVLYVTRETSR